METFENLKIYMVKKTMPCVLTLEFLVILSIRVTQDMCASVNI